MKTLGKCDPTSAQQEPAALKSSGDKQHHDMAKWDPVLIRGPPVASQSQASVRAVRRREEALCEAQQAHKQC